MEKNPFGDAYVCARPVCMYRRAQTKGKIAALQYEAWVRALDSKASGE